MDQTMRPIALKYTLDTTFTLSNSPGTPTGLKQAQQAHPTFDGYFRQGDLLYGKVTWNGQDTQHRRQSYKLELDKVYACQSHSKQFIPFFDPDTAQYGCSKPHKSLRHRLLVLDNNQNHHAHQHNPTQTSDTFQLNVDTLFQLANLTSQAANIEDEPWFIHVTYVISLRNDSSVHKRSANVYSLNNVYNNGTNMQLLKLTHKPLRYFEQAFQNQKGKYERGHERVFSFRDVFLNVLLPLFVLSVFVLFTAVTLVFYRKQIVKNKFWNMRLLTLKKKHKQNLSEFPHPQSMVVVETKPIDEKHNIYDNYENLMNLKQQQEGREEAASTKMNRLQLFLRSSRLFLIRNRAFNKTRTPADEANALQGSNNKCDVSGSNSTSGTLVASPLLDTNKMDSSATTAPFRNFDYEYLGRPDDEVFENEAVKSSPTRRLAFKTLSLRAFIQKMNGQKQSLKTVKRIHRSERLSSDYENTRQEESADEYYKETVYAGRQHRPLSCVSQVSSSAVGNGSGPDVPVRPPMAVKPCRNNYLYFNYNNNKMNYLSGETGNNNTSVISSGKYCGMDFWISSKKRIFIE